MAKTPRRGPNDEIADGIVDDGIVTPGMRTRELPGGGGVAADAGEYVLGTLDAKERERFERTVETDPEARDLAAFWRDRLAPLDDVAAHVAPPAAVWQAIERNLPAMKALANDNNGTAALKRSRNLWRGLALAAALVLAAVAFVVADPQLRGEAERRLGLEPGIDDAPVADLSSDASYLAVINAEGKLPALIVRVEGASGRVSVRPVALSQTPGRSLELWHIAQGQPDAVSIGLIDGATAISTVEARPGDTFAVTDEPEGGSPTGTATGPIVYSGQLLREPD